jgi:short-subunit dehydrogenase
MEPIASRPLAVVTGASSGIGYELAVQFARAGFDLIVAAEDQGITTAVGSMQEFGAEHGVQVVAVQADLATFDGVELLCAAVANAAVPPDALAVNAGVGVSGDFVRENDLADELRLVSLNVTSAVHLAKRVLPWMTARGSGGVLFTSSIAATAPGPYHATYAASKAFLLSFAEALGYELRDSGVTVTALMPGPTDTDFFERAGMQDTPLGQMKGKDDPAEVARQGFEALMAGRDHVVAGSVRNKVQAAMSKVMPEAAKARMQARMTEPESYSDGGRPDGGAPADGAGQ